LKKFFQKYGYLLAVAGIIIFFDQLTKIIVRSNLDIRETWAPWPWLEPYARIVHWQNTGAVFGILQGFGDVFMVLAMIVSAAIIYYFPQVPKSEWPLRLAMGMQCGGAIGNLIDRLHQGHVTDFISVFNFAVFNIADASISVGVAVLVIGVWIKEGVARPEQPLSPTRRSLNLKLTQRTPLKTPGKSRRSPRRSRGMGEVTEQVELRVSRDSRLDKFLVEALPEYSRSRLQGLIRDGLVLVDGAPASKAGQAVEAGQSVLVSIPAPQPAAVQAEDIPLEIIFENEDVLVVNKPAGMVVHPAAGHATGTLVHAALAAAPEMHGIGGEKRPGVVHRLDKDTSGVLALAKNDRTHRWLVEQFKDRRVEKLYLALVDGQPPTPAGRVEAPIGRSAANRQMMAIVPESKGRAAVSEYRTLESFPAHTLLEVRPHTGRTHQIRLHMAFLGCPVVGDKVYGRRKATLPLERHFLHAARLALKLPGERENRIFEAPLPPELQQVLDNLKQA
jgi:23S rRNA pseudouridine1911/1915/1917 synthase